MVFGRVQHLEKYRGGVMVFKWDFLLIRKIRRGFHEGLGLMTQLTIYIFRYKEGTVMAIMHPDNPVALKSATRYMEAMRSVCVRVADSGHWGRVA